jgi:hypothetical protein
MQISTGDTYNKLKDTSVPEVTIIPEDKNRSQETPTSDIYRLAQRLSTKSIPPITDKTRSQSCQKANRIDQS